MNFNSISLIRSITAIIMSGLLLFSHFLYADNTAELVSKLKKHYHSTLSVNAFSMTHNYLYLGYSSAYYSWDHKAPNYYTAFKVTEFDLKKKHYYESVVRNYPGGKKYNEVHFQNDTQSYRYETTGALYGKRLIVKPLEEYDEFETLIISNIDFLALRPLLLEVDISNTVSHHYESYTGKYYIDYLPVSGAKIQYVFDSQSLNLLSMYNSMTDRKYIYNDVQTKNGLSFARSIVQYSGDDKSPTFIKEISKIDILDSLEPSKLKIPNGFGPEIPEYERKLTIDQIEDSLYLITTPSNSRNTLVKIDNEHMDVFGAPLSLRYAEDTIKLLETSFPNKSIRSVYITHAHADHIAGLPAYADRDITILADPYSIKAIKAYPKFSPFIETFKFKAIQHEQIIDGTQFFILNNAHSRGLSFAHFKTSGVIYQADFLEIAQDNTIPIALPDQSKTFIEFIHKNKLHVKRIVHHHRNNNITKTIMDKSYQAAFFEKH